MNEENERTLESWIMSYAPHISQMQFSPGIPPPSANQPARPFYGRSNGNGPLVSDDRCATSVPRPPQYVSPTRGRFDGRGNSFQYQTEPQSMGPPKLRYQPAGPGLSIPLERETIQTHGQDRQAMPEFSITLERDNSQINGQDRQSTVQENGFELRNDARTSTGETKRSKETSPKQKRRVRVPNQS